MTQWIDNVGINPEWSNNIDATIEWSPAEVPISSSIVVSSLTPDLDIIIERSVSSAISITSLTDNIAFERRFTFNANIGITTSTTSDFDALQIRNLTSISNIQSVAVQIKYFSSTINIPFRTEENYLSYDNSGIINIGDGTLLTIEDNLFDYNTEYEINRWFNSTSNINSLTNDVSNLETSVLFNSIINIVSVTEKISETSVLKNNKKLEYLIDSFVSNNTIENNEKFKDLMQVFLRYLDNNAIYKALNLPENNNLNNIYPEFIDNFMNMYLNNVIDNNKYDLDYKNKLRFMALSRILNNSKGSQSSFSYLFNSLSNIRVADNDINIDIDKIITEYVENESWWEGYINYRDASNFYDSTIDHSINVPRPFTYQFKIDQTQSSMKELIGQVHPAGFQQEFLIDMNFEDESELVDELIVNTTYYHFYSGYTANKTTYYHDGTITRAGFHIITTTG